MLLCGWARDSLMLSLLLELDHGPLALPSGSSVVLFNTRPPEDITARLQRLDLVRISVVHRRGNPLQADSWERACDLSRLDSVLILHDRQWEVLEASQRTPGLSGTRRCYLEELHPLRGDALLLMASVNLRKLLWDRGLPPIHIVTEKLSGEVETRFEDASRLPMGLSINLAAESATLLAAVSRDPRLIAVASNFPDEIVRLADAAVLSRSSESLSYWDLVARAQKMGRVLLGYMRLPIAGHEPVELEINPQIDRAEQRTWNTGDGRTKLLMLSGAHPCELAGDGSVARRGISVDDFPADSFRIGLFDSSELP